MLLGIETLPAVKHFSSVPIAENGQILLPKLKFVPTTGPTFGIVYMLHRLRFATLSIAVCAVTGAAIAPTAVHATALLASNSVVLTSEVAVERTEVDASGKETRVLKKPSDVIVVPGDKLIFTLRYVNNGQEPATGFRATNPMPTPVQFESVAEDWSEVSVDGGKSWGKLGQLNIVTKSADGLTDVTRTAAPEDVTHVRWVFATPIAPGATGTVSYRGIIK